MRMQEKNKMNVLTALLACWLLPGCVAFVLQPSTTSSRRITTFVTQPRILVSTTSRTTTEIASTESNEVSSEATTTTTEESSSEEVSTSDDAPEANGASDDSSSDEEKDSEASRVLRERYTVFLGNMPFELTESEVFDLCSHYGTVQLVTIPKNRDDGRPRGFAFVDMSSPEEMHAVVDNLNAVQFKGRSLRVNVSEKQQPGAKKPDRKQEEEGVSKLYVGNLPFDTDREQLLEFYKEYVEAVDAYVPVNRDGTGRGFAFVSVKSEDFESAIEQTNGLEFQGRQLIVSKPLPPGQRSSRRAQARDSIKLYVGNLAFTTDVGILEEVFGEFGGVLDCYMPEDNERGGSRGFGFVTMNRDNGMEAIAELDGCELDGRIIRVNEALQKPRPSRDAFDEP